MTINHLQPQQPEYFQLTLENQDSLIDRFLVRIGDIVINNFTFLVFVAGVWGMFLLLLFGGSILIYTVGARLNELQGREHQRLILQKQQHVQLAIPYLDQLDNTSDKLDESDWFVILNDTVEEKMVSPVEYTPTIKQPSTNNQQHIIKENGVWQVSCGEFGFTIDTSYPCTITHIKLISPKNLANDVATTN